MIIKLSGAEDEALFSDGNARAIRYGKGEIRGGARGDGEGIPREISTEDVHFVGD